MFLDPITLRDQVVEPGSLAFTYRPESNDFTFGNIEDISQDALLVSYARAGRERRADASQIPLSEAVFPSEINPRDPGHGSTYAANDVVLKVTGVDTAEAYGVLANQEEPGHPLLVARIAYVPERGWQVVGDAAVIKTSDIFHPTMLSLIQRWRFLAPVHPLYDVLKQDAGEALDSMNPAILQIRDIDVPVMARLSLRGHVAEIAISAHYVVTNLLTGVRSEYLMDERLVPDAGADPYWDADVTVSGMSHNTTGGSFSGSIQVIPRTLRVVHHDEQVVVTRETYVGAKIAAWSDRIELREPPVNPLLLITRQNPPNCIHFNCFGNPAILYEPPNHDGVFEEYTSVVYSGETLPIDEHAVLSTFLGYITGGRARNAMTETFSLERKIVTVMHDRGEPTTRKEPPVPINQRSGYEKLITRHFGRMLNEFKRWRDVDSRSFDAVFHHYAEGVDSNYPVTRVLRLAIALEAFINLVTQDKRENENIVAGEAYKNLRPVLEECIRTYADAHRDDVPAEAETRFMNKIQGFNTASNTVRIRRFWELVPIILSDEDRDLLRRLRNQSVHQGFLGDDEGEQDVLGDAEDADRLCDIFNRALLHYACYTGPVLSSKGGRWMEAVTAETYRVPAIPHGGTIEIRHAVAPPPMTPEESAAAAQLNAVQRGNEPFETYIVDPQIQFPADAPLI